MALIIKSDQVTGSDFDKATARKGKNGSGKTTDKAV